MVALLVKASISAGIVAAAAIAAQRLGPVWGGLVASLPLSAGPAYAMLGLSHPAAFVGEVAANGLGANAATALFLLLLIRGVPRLGLLPALLLASLAWLGAALAVLAWQPGFAAAAVLSLVAYAGAIRLTSDVLGQPTAAIRAARWWELPLRCIALGLIVAGIVSLSDKLGPVWTGAGAVYPVGLTTLTLVAVPRLGRAGAAALLSGALRGMPGFVLFMMVMALGTASLGVATALVLGMAATLAWGGAVLAMRR